MTVGIQNENPTLTKVLNDAIKGGSLDLRVCLPVRVEKYDATTQKANVLPLLRQVSLTDNSATELPQITNVPVIMPSSNGGNSYISLPIKTGDLGWIICCDRSLGEYLPGSGQVVTPNQLRDHDLSDAVFIPGGRPFGSPLEDIDEDNMVVKNESLKITIDPTGRVSIEGQSQELLAILDSVLTNLITPIFLVGPASAGTAHTHPVSWPTVDVALTVDKTNLGTLLRTP